MKRIFKGLLAMGTGFLLAVLIFGVYLEYKDNNQSQNNIVEQDVDSTTNETYITKTYKNNYQSVVTVINMQKSGLSAFEQFSDLPPLEKGIGSGFIYKKEKGYYYAVTNNHVVEGADQLKIMLNDKTDKKQDLIDTQLVGTNTKYDVAVVKFKTKKVLNSVIFGDSDDLIPGEAAIAIGSPYGKDFQGSVTSGIISSTNRLMKSEGGQENEYIQSDVAINPGNSGGPLFNSKGQVIGMNTMKIADPNSDNMGFAIPINTVKNVIKEIELNE